MQRSCRRRALGALILLPAASFVLSGCAATQVKQVWRDASYPEGKLQNVLVIAAAAGTPTVQREIESQFAKRLRERGIRVTEGFRALSPEQLASNDLRDVVVAKIRELGVDSLLVVQRDSGRAEQEYIPGMTIQHGFGYGGWGGTSAVIASTAPPAPTTQGYGHTREFFGLQTQLFDTGTGKIVFSIRTETRVNGPLQEEIKPYVSLVSRKLFSEKLFP